MTLRALIACVTLALPAAAGDMEEARAMGDSVSRFAIDLYGKLRTEPGNLFFSPYSLSAALAMTREGAKGETAGELDKALSFPKDLAQGQRRLAIILRPPEVDEWSEQGQRKKVPAYELNVANALWGQDGLPFLAPFTGVLEKEYGAPLQRIDFKQNAEARRRINAWVEEQTRQRIKDIVPAPLPSPDTRLALANAIHFKASWEESFREEATRDAPFHAAAGDVQVKMMRRQDRFPYAEDPEVQVLSLPYRGRSTSMLIVLPRAKGGLPKLEESLTADKLDKWIAALKHVKVEAQVPRFTITQAFEASKVLGELGVKRAFDAKQADFSGMLATEPLFISAVLHKAFVAVDEKGTEAAAATVVMMAAGSAPRPEEPIPFVADHPFLFLIRHEHTGCVLFMGRLSAPEPAGK